MNRRLQQAGGSRRSLAVAAAVTASLIGCTAATAQLPQGPQDPAGNVLRQPVPKVVQDVVKGTPAEPVGDQISEVGGNVGANLPGGSSGSPGGNPSPRAGAARPSGRASVPAPSGRQGGAAAPGARGRAAGGDDSPAAGDALPPRPDATLTRSRPVAARVAPAPDKGVGRTIRDVVEVVPTAMWIALVVLAAISLGLVGRSSVERRRARRLEGEREELRRDVGLLESALLPAVAERIGSLSASAAHRSASGPAAGGDFYDAFELADGRAAVILGDASGHGREALERTRSICSTLRAYLDAGLEPRAALEVADRALPGYDSGNFATVVVGVHAPADDALTYAVAGHPPPIVTGPAASEPITLASSPPLGVGLRTGLRQTTVPFPRGSAAWFFTDGLLEARVADGQLGRERLEALVASLPEEEGAAALLQRVGEEAETTDDMAACMLRAVDGSERAGPRVEELELEARAMTVETPERFLTACGLSGEDTAPVLEQARVTALRAGAAVLRVVIPGQGDPSASVSSPVSRNETLLSGNAGPLVLADTP